MNNRTDTANTRQHPTTTWYVRDASGNLMATYQQVGDGEIRLLELPIYGSSRLGVVNVDKTLSELMTGNITTHQTGQKQYELSNHLGNVLTTISDQKKPVTDMNGNLLSYQPEILFTSDYYPFGMQMQGRKYTGEDYRFGFQGQESDDEVDGNKNFYAYKYRMHDARLGRFWSVDPLTTDYPWNSPYAFSENRVIDAVELEGLEAVITITAGYWQDRIKTQLKEGNSSENLAEVYRIATYAMSLSLGDLKTDADRDYALNDGGWTLDGKVGYISTDESFKGVKINYGEGENVIIEPTLENFNSIQKNIKSKNIPIKATGMSTDVTGAFATVGTQLEFGIISIPRPGPLAEHVHGEGMALVPMNKSASFVSSGAAGGKEASFGLINAHTYFSSKDLSFEDFEGSSVNVNFSIVKPLSGSINIPFSGKYFGIKLGAGIGHGKSASVTTTAIIKEYEEEKNLKNNYWKEINEGMAGIPGP